MKEIPETPIYSTANGLKSLKGNFHQDWNFVEVKTGNTLDLGEGKLIFIEAQMLHWPDSMFAYYTKDAVLFSNDAFGQYYASALMYNDLVDQAELYQETLKYYVNILTPFAPLVIKNDVMSEIFKSKLIVAGSSTINKGILSGMAATIEMMKGLKFKNKKAAAFGSYGWSGESPKLLTEALKASGFEMLEENLGVMWQPDDAALETCREYGVKCIFGYRHHFTTPYPGLDFLNKQDS